MHETLIAAGSNVGTQLGAAGASFSDLGLSPTLARAAAAAGWATPTAIQAQVLPAILSGQDVLAQAPTGSGKTAAFLLPLLQRLLDAPDVLEERPRRLRAVVLAPTRELAVQIGAAAHALAPQLKTLVTVGGLSINPQLMALRGGVHLLVATPGRLLDLHRNNALRLNDVQLLVLDEADRLLDLGFAEEIQRVLALMPKSGSGPKPVPNPGPKPMPARSQPRRQTLLLSATLPLAVSELAGSALRADAVRLQAGDDEPPPAITQRAIEVDTAQRTPLLRHLLRSEGWGRVLVFVATQYASEHVADKLRQAGVPAAALHGQLSQGRRSQVLADFHQGRLAVLVATDLAARGLDVQGLAAVVNHDLPRSAVDYTHRIGRTGRAGLPGVAISFICADAPGSEAHFRLIEKRQQQRVPREQVAGFEPRAVSVLAPLADPHGGLKGKRKSKKDKLREAAGRSR